MTATAASTHQRARRAVRFPVLLSIAPVALLTIGAVRANAQDLFSPSPGSPFLTGSALPQRVAVGDFNRDGRQDAAVTNQGNTVSVLLGDGAGRLSPAAVPAVANGASPFGLVKGDFNGDGRPDVVTAYLVSDNVSVFLGDGAGGLSPVGLSGVPSGGDRPASIAIGDLNGDGRLDVVTGNENSNNVSVLLGNGQGGLSPASGSPFATGSSITREVAPGDFNGDGRLDVVVSSGNSGGRVSVLLGNGQGGLSLAPGSPFDPGAGTGSLVLTAAGDFNRDGRLDVVIARTSPGNTVSVLVGDGQGGLSPVPGSSVATGGSGPVSSAVWDLDGDGNLDVAIANAASNDVSVLLGDGQGRLNPVVGSPFDTGGDGAGGVAVGDFNGDRRPDLLVTNDDTNNVSVLLGRRP